MATIAQVVGEFVDYAATVHAPKTAQTYKTLLKPLAVKHGKLSARRLDHELLTKFVKDISFSERWQRPASPSTIRASIRTAQVLTRFAVSRGYLKKAVTLDFRVPVEKIRDRIPSRSEQAAVLKLARRPFRLLFQALRYSGARPSELRIADIENYDQKRKMIVLGDHKNMRRTGYVRRISVGKRLARILRYAMADRKTGPIFVTARGTRWGDGVASSAYRRLRRKAGLDEELCLYSATRHEFATRMTRKHGIYVAAKALGRVELKSCFRYVHMKDEEMGDYQDSI